MMYLVIAVLLVVVILFGVASTSQSYAAAQQAKAQIEVAQLGQINAWGNLVMILTVALLIVLVVALVAVLIWGLHKRSTLTRPRAGRPMMETKPDRQVTVSDLIQLETLRMLKEMRGTSSPALPGSSLEEPADEPPLWLR